jgi:hypothetical protein
MTMPLIVAIEPDRGQATQLKAVVRAKLRAELVLADTAEAALKALGDRIPDLVLTSAFLSPRDEAALAERLRTLDAAAAHVQTLTIPVLDAPKPAHSSRGMLSSILSNRGHSAAPDGCDPAVFAEQCAAYLERAASERASQVIPEPEPIEEIPAVTYARAPEPHVMYTEAPEAPSTMDTWLSRIDARSEPAVEARSEPPIEQPIDAPDTAAAFELDLSSLLDETVVHELSAAIETVTAAAAPSSGKGKAKRAGAPLARSSKSKPTEDDWGLFDPAQCGFAALLAKFDEVTRVAPPLPTDSLPAGSLDVSH